MQFAVTFRHMEPTEALKAYARERMERVRKYLPDPISCHVVLSTERHNHRIDVSFQLHNGLSIAGHETTENMYSSIDLVIAKIERQVRKYKGKLEGMRARPPRGARPSSASGKPLPCRAKPSLTPGSGCGRIAAPRRISSTIEVIVGCGRRYDGFTPSGRARCNSR